MEQRGIVLVLGGIAVMQIAATSLGFGFWQCPIKAVTGKPCPVCGMSAAISALIKGDWRESLQLHAFAPVFLLAFMVFILTAIAPGDIRLRIIQSVKLVERKTGIGLFLLLALLIYWLVRLAGFI
jgi:hypothetical protein